MDDLVMRAAELLGAVIKEQTESIRAELVAEQAKCDECMKHSATMCDERERQAKATSKQIAELEALLGYAKQDTHDARVRIGQLIESADAVRAECDAACADRDKAVREAQALRERVQAAELALLEVRKTSVDALRAAGVP